MFVRGTVCTHVRSYVHVKAHASVCVRAHIRVYASMNFPGESMSAHMHTNIHTCIQIYRQPHVSTRTFARIRGHMHAYIQTSKLKIRKIRDVHIIHTHTYIYTNVRLHTDRCTGITFMPRTLFFLKKTPKKTVQTQMKCHHSGISSRYSLFANTSKYK